MAVKTLCTDCRTVHGPYYTQFTEWAWHFPPYEEVGRRSLGELRVDYAAQLAWRYQGERIAALEAELLRLNGPVCPLDGKRASEHTWCTRRRTPAVLCPSPAPCGVHDRYRSNEIAHQPWPEGEQWRMEQGREVQR